MEPCAPPPRSWNDGLSPFTAAPLDRYQTAPRMDSSPPSVTMNEGTPMYAMMKPWKPPMAAPRRMPSPRAMAQLNGTSLVMPNAGNQSVMSRA